MDVMPTLFFCGAVYAWLKFVSFLFQGPLRDVPPWLAYGHYSIIIFTLIFLSYRIYREARILLLATLEFGNRARA